MPAVIKEGGFLWLNKAGATLCRYLVGNTGEEYDKNKDR
jgi:hypothetical protein